MWFNDNMCLLTDRKPNFRKNINNLFPEINRGILPVSGWERDTAVDRDFEKRGGQAGRVLLVPKNTGFQARRYNARFQLERSRAKSRQVEVTLAEAFTAWPGELVKLVRPGWSRNGVYRVQESRVTLGEKGVETTLVLGYTNAVL